MEKLTSYSQLEHHDDLLEEVINQVNKDFGSSQISFEWRLNKENPYLDFIQQVEQTVEALLLKDMTVLKSALYRMDVFESKLRMAWTLDHKDQVKRLTELILNRALQKVVTRKMYKQK